MAEIYCCESGPPETTEEYSSMPMVKKGQTVVVDVVNVVEVMVAVVV